MHKPDLSHWLHPGQIYQPVDIALLLAGIDPYLVGKNPSSFSDNAQNLLNTAKQQSIPGWEKAFFFYSHIVQGMRMDVIDHLPGLELIYIKDLDKFFKHHDIKEFPKGHSINSTPNIESKNSQFNDITCTSKQTYLSIIGAMATVLAELDESKERPLKGKKIVRSDGISAKAIADIISKRFEGGNLPLKRSNTAISEALKLIEEAEKACV